MRIEWDKIGSRFFETGVDRGVFYPAVGPGVPWNGLISIQEDEDAVSQTVLYLDGVRYTTVVELSSFLAVLSAITFPEEFEPYDGTEGFLKGQTRKTFSLSYRTLIGSDLQESGSAYKIHLVYNALADPSDRNNQSLNVNLEITPFEWILTTTPITIPDFRASAHLIVDSRTTNPEVLETLEGWLYGTSVTTPRMPSINEVLNLFDQYAIFQVVDNGNGTATITGPDEAVYPLGYDDLWTLDYISVNQIAPFTYIARSH